MGLAAGARLGPYEITSAIGAGGMGQVYQARDTRLGRTVAIKVLLPALASDPERRARFEREARTIAALNHPHICTLHDVGNLDGSLFLVMEHIAGETLAARLQKGALPLEQALAIAKEIAEALTAAHRHGVVHRDLKPGNVMLTATGVKLLDFGLAKLKPGVPPAAMTLSALPTQEPATEAGSILGTVPYMAPEQLEGKEADARSDIFSFGAVLYEMLTGRRAFQGESHASVIAAIFATERPSPLAVRPDLPVALERLVLNCLATDPAARWQSAQDISLYLTSASDPPAAVSPMAPRRHRAWTVAAAWAVLLVAAVVAAAGWWRASAGAPAMSVTRLSLPLPSDALLAPNDGPAAGSSVAISPDGRSIVFVATRDGARTLAIRWLASGGVKTLPRTEGAMSPFFSPDGRWVGFFTETGLRKVSIEEGTLASICPTPPVTRGGVWTRDGTIYFSPDFSRGLQSVPATGGVPREVTRVRFDAGESNHLLPEVLPDGKTVLFTVWKGGSFKDAGIWSVSLPDGKPQLLVESATAPRYVAPGYLVFAREGSLFAVPFDPARAALAGDAFPVVDGVWTDPATGTTHYAVGQDGTLVFAAGKGTVEQRRLVWVDRGGRVTRAGPEPNLYGNVRLSPDGTRAAVELLNDIWVYDFNSGALSRATYRGVNSFPVWSPDGRHIAIASSQGVSLPTLFSIAFDGGEPAVQLAHEPGLVQFPGSWTPDGRRLAYAAQREAADTGFNIRILDLDRGSATSPVVATPFTDETPMVSPDGQALAYVSDETGRSQVYVCSFPGKGTRIQVSRDGGYEPVWSRKGDELFFRSGRRMLSVRVRTTGELRVSPPAVLFEGDFVVTSLVPSAPSYDVAPDGRFLMVAREGEQPLPRQLEVVLNWTSELAQRAGQRRR